MEPLKEEDKAGGHEGKLLEAAVKSNGALEAKCRRYVAKVHIHKYGDREAAAQMLAWNPPGAGIAPHWLVKEANDVSRDNQKARQRTGTFYIPGVGFNNA